MLAGLVVLFRVTSPEVAPVLTAAASPKPEPSALKIPGAYAAMVTVVLAGILAP